MKWLCALAVFISVAAGCTGAGPPSGTDDTGTEPEPRDAGGGDDGWGDADQTTDDMDDTGDDGADGEFGDQGGPDAGDGPDYDPSEYVSIAVPEGASLCTSFLEGRTWRQELALVGRIDLRPGRYLVPREGVSEPVEFIENVFFGPERTVPEAIDETATLRLIDAYAPPWILTYGRNYLLADRPYRVRVEFALGWDGRLPEEVVLDEFFMLREAYGSATIGPGEDRVTERQGFGACTFPNLGVNRIAHAGDIDQVALAIGFASGCTVSGMTTCVRLYRAEVTLGADTGTVTDGLHLIYSANHHNSFEHYLILLEPPMGDVSAVLVDYDYLTLMDENLEILRNERITEWQPNL